MGRLGYPDSEKDCQGGSTNQRQRLATAELALLQRDDALNADALVPPFDAAVTKLGYDDPVGVSVARDYLHPVADSQQLTGIDTLL